MKIQQLKEIIKDMADDIEVVVPAFDHSYEPCYSASMVDAEYDTDYGIMSEHYDYDGFKLEKGVELIKVLVIG